MKVEKINENQIRFEFMAQDLAERNINISDIITPSANKTQGLFREITGILHEEYGFATIGTPLVFEATMSHDTLSVLVTKMAGNDEYGEYNENNGVPNFQNIISDIMSQMKNNGYNQDGLEFVSANIHHNPHGGFLNGNIPRKGRPGGNTKARPHRKKPNSGYCVFSFENFDMLAAAASRIPENYKGRSHVYKREGKYYFILQNVGNSCYSTKNFEAQISEFGQKQITSLITYNQMLEHGEVIIAEEAICKLKAYQGI